jgi:integrase
MRDHAHPQYRGITVRHQTHCPEDGPCRCKARYRAEVYDPSTKRPRKSPWMALADARGWHTRTKRALLNSGTAPRSSLTVEQTASTWLHRITAGTIPNRSGLPYKPSVARSYETSLRLHIYPLIGGKNVATLKRVEVQEVVDQLRLTCSASTVKNALNPLRAMFRWLVTREIVEADPTDGLEELPQGTRTRSRIAKPDEAARLIDALPSEYQPIWATAFYSGLRLGELRALRVSDVDLQRGLISVNASWDVKAGFVAPKSEKSIRKVPIPAVLQAHLRNHLEQRASESELIFGTAPGTPFKSEGVRRESYSIWKKADLDRIGFHEARHTYASILIDAGLNPKKVQVYMGHSSISTTLNIYAHLFDGNEEESVKIIDNFLAAAK